MHPTLKLSDFDYTLPAHLIAQEPLEQRDHSRVFLLDAATPPGKTLGEEPFHRLPGWLRSTLAISQNTPVLLVRNNAKVFPARVPVMRTTGGEGEVFLWDRLPKEDGSQNCFLRPQKKLRVGELLLSPSFHPTHPNAPLFEVVSLGTVPRVKSLWERTTQEFYSLFGHMPLPPYIERDLKHTALAQTARDAQRYQTIYAKEELACAAPTAGLHFTPQLEEECLKHQIHFCDVTLNVGAGTFAPVQTEDIPSHTIHQENYHISPQSLEEMLHFKDQNWPIVYVGTTSFRCVESFFLEAQNICQADSRLSLNDALKKGTQSWHSTQLFVYPQTKSHRYVPQLGQAMITNFHQPCSTLVMLVSSLMGYEFWRSCYQEAVKKEFRFLSYGDCCFIKWSEIP